MTAVVYITAALVLIVGILALYDCLRYKLKCAQGLELIRALAMPAVCILIGVILFFNKWEWIFVLAGILTVLEGGLILADALSEN